MRRSTFFSILVALWLCATGEPAEATNERVILAFDGADGQAPFGALVADRAGNLYAQTPYGGRFGYGVIFELSPPAKPAQPWVERIIYTFQGGLYGGGSTYGLTSDAAGNLYGATLTGGRFGVGVAFVLTPPSGSKAAWHYHVIHQFGEGGGNAVFPSSALTLGPDGVLYGVSAVVGHDSCGAAFALEPPRDGGRDWRSRIIYHFSNCTGRGEPENALTYFRGALYGTTTFQVVGTQCYLFRLTPPHDRNAPWTLADLHDFGAGGDGDFPTGAPVFDADGNLYGATEGGGLGTCLAAGCGTIFRLAPPPGGNGPWTETLLYEFTGGNDGGAPLGNVTFGAGGAIYGTTAIGGAQQQGVVFAVTPQPNGPWSERVLHAFAGGADGEAPQSGVLRMDGMLFGTTPYGGGTGACGRNGCGTVFEVAE